MGHTVRVTPRSARKLLRPALTARVADRYSFRVGANNIDGSRRSSVPGYERTVRQQRTYPQVYDALGRYLFAGVTVDF
jgi:hypothetical protein